MIDGSSQGNVQKIPSSKAAAFLTRGAYSQYVSTAKRRERRWRIFSTFPTTKVFPEEIARDLSLRYNSSKTENVSFLL
jgi:hypothetical protein